MIKDISVQDAHDLIKAGKAILIDVRERDEYEEAHIKEAQLHPLSDLPCNVHGIDIPDDKDIIIHCKKGPRGYKAGIIFQLTGCDLDRFYNMDGGITAWMEAGLPVET